MTGGKEIQKKASIGNGSGKGKNKKNKTKNKRGGNKRKAAPDQSSAHTSVCEWVFLDQKSSGKNLDGDFLVHSNQRRENLVFEMHCHSNHSDGFLPPSKVVERAHQNGVKVLALTDHDTLSGIPEALEAASRFGIKIIPGVEVSAIFFPRGEPGSEELVHILAYYSSCGPTKADKVEKMLRDIKEGRFVRAKSMVSKLNQLKFPLKWEAVLRIAGKDAAPGRVHVARAMVEAGYVENLKQAFAWYLYDGGPAYATGSEPVAEEAVKIICETGGIAVLAHPWTLKNPVAIVRRLKEAGLQGIEAYRSDGKVEPYINLGDTYDLVKLGGSDFHGKVGEHESELGSVSLPVLAVHEFLKRARPIWRRSIADILENYVDHPTESNFQLIKKYCGRPKRSGSANEFITQCLSSWLTIEERQNAEFEAIKLKVSGMSIDT
ncbi:unnamed protein product [Cuscuta campestris]|uniref:Polymerase/histidinol phosphatase N-terminal domain-containing protein n=2 Tax=Cuscuta sect. Cleistogrammica TaxID=1824901 RepID=A0A484N908_9ASTE|nr:hypothetical protein DM860_003746 [Cuscuta australis]VFQ96344.1 unnamed protein product [Cuscuta campestris]